MKAPRPLPGALGWADLERERRRARIWDAIVCALAVAVFFLPMFIDLFGA